MEHNHDFCTITLTGHVASVDPGWADLVASLLPNRQHPVAVANRSWSDQFPENEHHVRSDDGRLHFLSGLVQRVRRELESHGYEVDIVDTTLWGHLRQANRRLRNCPSLSEIDRRYVNTLLDKPHGEILARNSDEAARLIALMGRLFAHNGIYVALPTRQAVHRLVQRIREHTERPVTADSREMKQHHPPMFIGTRKLFEAVSPDADDFQIVVFVDIDSVSQTLKRRFVELWQDGSWYAVNTLPQTLHAVDEFQIEEVFGPVIWPPEKWKRRVNIRVALLDCNLPRSRGFSRPLHRKRELYWHNRQWIRFIAAIAKGFAVGRPPAGYSHAISADSTPIVSVLVESTEQAQQLQTMLPRWEVWSLPVDPHNILESSHKKIMTVGYARDQGLYSDVVIRADAGAGWPLDDVFDREIDRRSEPILIVDIADQRDQQARADFQSRRNAYEMLGWPVVDREQ